MAEREQTQTATPEENGVDDGVAVSTAAPEPLPTPATVVNEPKAEDVQALEPERDPNQFPFVFDPLAPYKGAFRRFFTVYRHVIGLLLGGLVTYVRALPPERKRGMRSGGIRMAAFMLKPFVKRDLLKLPFPVQLRRRLEILGPTFIKLGQILAIREDLLPPAVTEELQNLFDRLPNIPFAEVQRIIEHDLHKTLDTLFAHLHEEPLGSASIAQAHRAETHTGEKVVVKVIKPGIRDAIVSDLKLLELVGIFLQWIIPKYQPRQVVEEFSTYTIREVDYTYEADSAEIFTVNFADEPDIVFPKIYRDLSSQNVLTMEFFDGFRPGSPQTFELPEETRHRVLDLGAAAIIRMLYQDGFFHADLHAGNLLILPPDETDKRVRVGFIDLGMVGRFEEKTKRRMLYYFYALVSGDVESASRYLTSMARVGEGGDPQGFRRAVADLARRFVMHGSGGDVSIAAMMLASIGLGARYRLFFPVEMTLMVKALVTFEGVGRMMDPHLNVVDASQQHIARIFRDHFNPAALSQALMRSAPEMADLLVQMPQFLASGVKFIEDQISDTSRSNPLAGLRSSILAGACIVGGALAVVQGGPIILWLALFALGAGLALFGK